MKPIRLAIVETHPIQYKAPLFRRLAAQPELNMHVFYAMLPDAAKQGGDFGVSFAWDVPLLDGYPYTVLTNRAKQPSVSRFNGCDTPDILKQLRAFQPDAVLVNGWVVKTCLQALQACRRLGVPCLVRGEANLLRPRALWKHLLHRILLRQYAGYLAIGSANRDFYRFHRCPEERIFWAPYVVDNAFFASQAVARTERRSEIRAGLGLAPQATVFLFCGKLMPKKRPLDLLKAIGRLPPETRAQVQMLVAGDGELRAECEHMAKDLSVTAVLTGFVNQSRLPDVYATADVLVLPSDAGETWGLVVNEAMASGRPAVVSRAVGCCPDLIVEGETGHAFDLGDIRDLSRILEQYVHAPERAAQQGEAAGRHIQAFSYQEAIQGILSAARVCAGRESC
ncbi:MAG: glycosyltransferase family 4 protein [Lentisphaerae bacterium]|jgi:glycosyltransferase involved in cell wall biosynthesis|nr:glycosyltransferase family 4 protein [Lentisphaerota bacterium]